MSGYVHLAPHYRERGTFAAFDHPLLGSVELPAIVPRLSETPGRIEWLGPGLGEHTDEILVEELGYDRGRIDKLRAQGVV